MVFSISSKRDIDTYSKVFQFLTRQLNQLEELNDNKLYRSLNNIGFRNIVDSKNENSKCMMGLIKEQFGKVSPDRYSELHCF